MASLHHRLLRPQSVSNAVLVVALVALAACFTSQSSTFLSPDNVVILANNAAALGVVVVPFALLVISGNIDFSVGSTAGLSGMVLALAVTRWGFSEGAAIALALLVATGVGVVNALLCVVLRFNPIIVTLGMLGAIRGGTLLVQEDQIYGIGPLVESLGSGTFLGIPYTLCAAIAMFLLGAAFLTLTPSGRHVFAIGVNRHAAYLSALPVRTLPFALYVVTGFSAGLAGLVFAARLNGVSPAVTGEGMEFAVLTIVLLGGVAFAGGRGNLFGVLVAWLFLATLQNGLVLTNVTPYVQTASAGVALVLAAALDRLGATVIPRLLQRAASAGAAEPDRREPADLVTPPPVRLPEDQKVP